MQSECLVRDLKGARLSFSLRFLQLVSEEAVERDISITDQSPNELTAAPREFAFELPTPQQPLQGSVEISAEMSAEQVFRLRLHVKNLCTVADAATRTRAEILPQSFISTHLIMNVEDGEFVSLLEPPEDLRELAASCQNIGCWPVLVGEPGERDCLLSSPIILYDYPKLATESAGDFYDSTEIDELLTLRVLTLTDDEKHEMRCRDLRTRQVLERTEALPVDHLALVHGAIRGLAALKDNDSD